MARARWSASWFWAVLAGFIFISSSFFLTGSARDDSYYIGEIDEIELVLNDTIHMSGIIGGDNRNPRILEDAIGAVVVLWDHQDSTTGTGGAVGTPSREIFMSMADRWGTVFGNASHIDLGNENRDKRNVDLAISNRTNRYYIVWEQEMENGNTSTFFGRSFDRGTTFEEIKEIATGFESCIRPKVAVSYEGDLFCIFLGRTVELNQYQIYFAHSNNEGESFSEPVIVSDSEAGRCNTTSLYVYKGYVFCVWEANNRVYFSRISTEDKVIKEPKIIDKLDGDTVMYKGPHYVNNPLITGDENGTIYALWDDNREGEDFRHVFWAKSNDNGDFFHIYPPAPNNYQRQQGHGSFDIAPDGNEYIVYRNGYDVYIRRNAEMEKPQTVEIKTYGKRTGTPRILAFGKGCLVVYELGTKENPASPREIKVLKYLEVIVPQKENGKDDPYETKWYEKSWSIALFVFIILAVAFIVMGKWTSRKRKEEGLTRMKKDAAASQGGAGKKKKRRDAGDEKGFDGKKLTRELKEKRTALLLLEAELESKNITPTEYDKLKKEYEDRIVHIERKVGGRKNLSTYK